MARGDSKPAACARAGTTLPVEPAFDTVVGLIRAARQRSAQAVNAGLIDLYWRIGSYLHRKVESDGWAKGTVINLAAFIAQREPGMRGFSAQNLWRMRQFFAAYSSNSEATRLSTLSRKLPWSAHLHILGRAKGVEERQFYLRTAVQQRWSVRELARQIDSGLFERVVLDPPKLSTALRDLQPAAEQQFRDAYMLEFLSLPDPHTDLEALDRDVRKPHENPAIGVLLCARKDDEVVEYALSRSASPALIAQYRTQLPDKALLQAKLQEFYRLGQAAGAAQAPA